LLDAHSYTVSLIMRSAAAKSLNNSRSMLNGT